MTDDPELPEEPEECESLYSEHVDYAGGVVIFPAGAEYFADQIGALAVRVIGKTGDIEMIGEGDSKWRGIGRKPGKLESIK